jgi:hypothetical protein
LLPLPQGQGQGQGSFSTGFHGSSFNWVNIYDKLFQFTEFYHPAMLPRVNGQSMNS